MTERITPKTVERLRTQMLRSDALQQAASLRFNRAFDEYQRLRVAYEDAVYAYVLALEETAGLA